MNEAYFAQLSDALRAASIHQPALVLDLDRLNANIAAIKTRLPKELALRIVDKSLPCLQLLEVVRSAFQTERFMTFHLPVSAEVLGKFPSGELLLGKPIPVEGARHALKNGVLASVESVLSRIVWLIDTDQRLAEYGALAAELGTDLRFCFEVDVGLHRGGYRDPDALVNALVLLEQYPGLKCQGVMAYEPQIGHIPKFLGGPVKAQARATSLLRQFAACLGKDQRAIVNTGGSSTALLYDGWVAANELSVGSAFVLPTDFDVASLAALQPAAFIATPILKVLEPEMPGLDERTSLLRRLGLFPRRGCYIYGGKWMARPVHPAGMKPNSTIGFSTNQQFMGLPANVSAKPGDYAFLRPTQSEFVLQQFGTIRVYSEGRIVDSWPALPLS